MKYSSHTPGRKPACTRYAGRITPANADDTDWDFPSGFKDMISLIAKEAAKDYLESQKKPILEMKP